MERVVNISRSSAIPHRAHAIVRAVLEPAREIFLREPGPPADAQPLLQIKLIHRRDDEQDGKPAKIKQLALEDVPILLLHRVVEARVPFVELHVEKDRCEFEQNDDREQGTARPAILPHEIRNGEAANIGEEGEDRAQGRLRRFGGFERIWPRWPKSGPESKRRSRQNRDRRPSLRGVWVRLFRA
jgi:hypothetical protein